MLIHYGVNHIHYRCLGLLIPYPSKNNNSGISFGLLSNLHSYYLISIVIIGLLFNFYLFWISLLWTLCSYLTIVTSSTISFYIKCSAFFKSLDINNNFRNTRCCFLLVYILVVRLISEGWFFNNFKRIFKFHLNRPRFCKLNEYIFRISKATLCFIVKQKLEFDQN